MRQSGNFLVNTYRYEPDYWNLKPPMSFWGIMLGFKLLGTTVLGMRFYSAAAFFLTIVLATVFVCKRYSRIQAAFVVLLLGSCAPFYYIHFARNGDADALFTLFMTICMLTAMLLRERPGLIWICGLSFSCSFLCKSWHVLMILGIAGVYFLWGKLYKVFQLRHWIVLIMSAGLPILLWAGLRYRYDGFAFLGQMVEYDLLARTTGALEGHSGGALFYLRITMASAIAGFFAVFLAIYFGYNRLTEANRDYIEKDTNLRRDIPFYLIWFFIPLLQFTVAETKLAWYIYPAMVGLLMLCGILTGSVIKKAGRYRWDAIVVGMLLLISIGVDAVKIEEGRRQFPADGVQTLITEELSSQAQLKGKAAYLEVDPNVQLDGTTEILTSWPQRYVFLGEAYLDARCEDGGTQKFLEKGGMLITSRDRYEHDKRLRKMTLAAKNNNYVCILQDG